MEARAALFSSSTRQETIQKAFEAGVANLVSELRLSFDYFTTEKNMPIGQLYLIGEGVAVAGIESVILASLEIPLSVWNPFEKLALRKGLVREDMQKDGRRFITALGLALNEYDTI